MSLLHVVQSGAVIVYFCDTTVEDGKRQLMEFVTKHPTDATRDETYISNMLKNILMDYYRNHTIIRFCKLAEPNKWAAEFAVNDYDDADEIQIEGAQTRSHRRQQQRRENNEASPPPHDEGRQAFQRCKSEQLTRNGMDSDDEDDDEQQQQQQYDDYDAGRASSQRQLSRNILLQPQNNPLPASSSREGARTRAGGVAGRRASRNTAAFDSADLRQKQILYVRNVAEQVMGYQANYRAVKNREPTTSEVRQEFCLDSATWKKVQSRIYNVKKAAAKQKPAASATRQEQSEAAGSAPQQQLNAATAAAANEQAVNGEEGREM